MPKDSQENRDFTLDKELDLTRDFEVPDYESWKELAEASLKGAPFEKKLITRTYEGIDVKPIYRDEDIKDLDVPMEMPGFGTYSRGCNASGYAGKPWKISQKISGSCPDEFNKALIHDGEKGLDSAEITLGEGAGSLNIKNLKDLASAFSGVDLKKIPLFFKAGDSASDFCGLFKDYLYSLNLKTEDFRGALLADPLFEAALCGGFKKDAEKVFDDFADSVKMVNSTFPNAKSAGVDSTVFADAGADSVTELGLMLATGITYLNEMVSRGIDIDTAASSIRFTMNIGSFYFMEIVKIRCARILWSRIVEAFGGSSEAAKIDIHGVTSSYNQTRYDPYVNMLRTTTEAFSAVIGGVSSLSTNPFDQALGKDDDFSRRIARNTQIILREESHLDSVIDPVGGSYFVETLTDEFCKTVWAYIQEIEGAGGVVKVLSDNSAQKRIAEVHGRRVKDASKRKYRIVGVNMYSNLTEELIKKDGSDEKCSCSEKTDSDLSFEPLVPVKIADDFEFLRESVDNFRKKSGKRPEIFLVPFGNVSQYKPRADFSKGFFEVGGFDVVLPESFKDSGSAVKACRESGAEIFVICSADSVYPEVVPGFVKELKKEMPSSSAVLAGYPKDMIDAFREAGIDDFIFMGADVMSLLTSFLKKAGVLK